MEPVSDELCPGCGEPLRIYEWREGRRSMTETYCPDCDRVRLPCSLPILDLPALAAANGRN